MLWVSVCSRVLLLVVLINFCFYGHVCMYASVCHINVYGRLCMYMSTYVCMYESEGKSGEVEESSGLWEYYINQTGAILTKRLETAVHFILGTHNKHFLPSVRRSGTLDYLATRLVFPSADVHPRKLVKSSFKLAIQSPLLLHPEFTTLCRPPI